MSLRGSVCNSRLFFYESDSSKRVVCSVKFIKFAVCVIAAAPLERGFFSVFGEVKIVCNFLNGVSLKKRVLLFQLETIISKNDWHF